MRLKRRQIASLVALKPASELDLHDKFYASMLECLTAAELSWLLSDNPSNSVSIYDHASKSVRRAGFEIPWPILFFLGYRHKKHRFIGAKLPSVDNVIRSVSETVDKIRWHAF